MAPRKVTELPDEKRDEAGGAAPEVPEAAVAAPPRPPRGAPGMIRLQATRYYKNGTLLSPANGFKRAYVNPDDIIEVTPELFRQLRADVRDAFAPVQ